MDGAELLKKMPGAIGFFAIDDFPGVIMHDKQAWIFEGGIMNPRPITRDEIKKRSGSDVPADWAAELFDLQPGALDFLDTKKKDKQEFFDPSEPRDERGRWTDEGGEVEITHENVEDYRGGVKSDELAKHKDNIEGAFNVTSDTKIVPIHSLISNKNHLKDPKFVRGEKDDPRQTATDRMVESTSKGGEKRAPLKVTDNDDGTYTIEDGNATAQAAMLAGWTKLPVDIQKKYVEEEGYTDVQKKWIREHKQKQKEFEKGGKLGLRYDADLTGERVPANQLTDYLHMVSGFQHKQLVDRGGDKEGMKYGGLDDFLVNEGKEFDVPKEPPQIKLMTAKECYSNATHMMLDNSSKYGYVEGKYVSTHLPFPIDHAWLVDKKTGTVVDPTLGWQPKARYFGVQYSKMFVIKKMLQNKYYGIHSNGNMVNDVVLGKDKEFKYAR